MPVGANTLAYNSLWQVRNDARSSLEEAAAQLVLAGARQHPVEQLTETVTGLLDVLGLIERFWAFPGVPAFHRARHLFAADEYTGFHPSFPDGHALPTPEGDVRRAFYLSYNDSNCEYLKPDEIEQRIENGEVVVSTTYVTPYPPGYPVLVPGQVFSPEILSFMRSLDTPEIHGYRADLGYRVYVDKALEMRHHRQSPAERAAGHRTQRPTARRRPA